MSKFDPIRAFLSRQTGDVEFTFDELSSMLTGGLPRSAFVWEMWWADNDSTHTQSASWSSVGYSARPDLAAKTVRFTPA